MSIYEDGTYASLHPTWDEEDSQWKAAQVLKLLKRNGVEFTSFADVGCGAGRVIHELSLHYPSAQFHGYDVSPQAIALARNHETSRVRFFNEDVRLHQDPRYDVLAAIDVFEHVEDYMGFLREMRRLSRWCVFHIPLDISVQAILRNLPMTIRHTAGHLHYFMKETALATLEDTGFQVLDFFYTASGLALARSFRARLAALPRRAFLRLHPDLCVKILGGYSLMVLATERSS